MSTASAADTAAPAKGKKKLIVIVAVVALVLAGAGGAAAVMMKKKAAAAEAELDGDGSAPGARMARHDPKAVPIFAPLEPFTVNLADRDAERFAQVGITLELDDAATADRIKAYMPVIRNNILLAIADRTAAELQGREGKQALAERIRGETARALGVEAGGEDTAVDEATDSKPAKKKRKSTEQVLPVRAVHFSNFIIQ